MNTDFDTSEDYENIKNKILDYLGRQDYSEAKLLQKVCSLKKNYPQTKRYDNYTKENILYVIGALKKKDIINEQRALENMLLTSLKGIYGIRKIQEKMYVRLYRKKNIEIALKNFKEIDENPDYTRIIGMTKRKKESIQRRYPDADEYQVKEKLFQFLVSKGFEYDAITIIINQT